MDGRSIRRLADSEGHLGLAISPDERWNAVYRSRRFDRKNFQSDLRVIRTDGSESWRVVRDTGPVNPSPGETTWTPDGNSLVYVDHTEIGFPSATVGRELLKGSKEAWSDFHALRVPALALYSTVEGGERDPVVAWQRRRIERFRREAPCGRVMELRAHHYLFIEQKEEVVRATRRFLLEEPASAAVGGPCPKAGRR